jgi:hypothetical protein
LYACAPQEDIPYCSREFTAPEEHRRIDNRKSALVHYLLEARLSSLLRICGSVSCLRWAEMGCAIAPANWAGSSVGVTPGILGGQKRRKCGPRIKTRRQLRGLAGLLQEQGAIMQMAPRAQTLAARTSKSGLSWPRTQVLLKTCEGSSFKEIVEQNRLKL